MKRIRSCSWIFTLILASCVFCVLAHSDYETTKVSLRNERSVSLVHHMAARDVDPTLFEFPSPSSCEVYENNLNCIRMSPYYAPSCSRENCIYFAAYYKALPNTTEIVFHLSAENADYVGLGFSDTAVPKLNTDIIACVREGNNVVVKSYFWPEWKSDVEEMSISKDELKIIKGEPTKRGLWCTVQRAVYTKEEKLKDLLFKKYQFNILGKNGADDSPSFENKNYWSRHFRNVLSSTHENDIQHTEIFPSNINCDNRFLNCIRYEFAPVPSGDCSYKTCSYMMAWVPRDPFMGKWPFFLAARNAQYVAIGRTKDEKQWSNTDVIGCKRLSDNSVVPFYYWVGNLKGGYTRQTVTKGLKLVDSGITDSGLWCSMSLEVDELDRDYSNFAGDAFMLYMWGKLDKDGDPEHWKNGHLEVSEDEVYLQGGDPIHLNDVRVSSSVDSVVYSVPSSSHAGYISWIVFCAAYFIVLL